jgi:hypothetical protein
MNDTAPKLPRTAAVALIAGATFVAVIAIVLVTLLLKPLASEAATQPHSRTPVALNSELVD